MDPRIISVTFPCPRPSILINSLFSRINDFEFHHLTVLRLEELMGNLERGWGRGEGKIENGEGA